MTKTVTSLFDSHSQADAAISRLEQAGISRSSINVLTGTSADLTDELSRYGVPASDAHAYAEGVRRGGTLVAVSCESDEADRVIDILEGDEGILDLDEQQSTWRSEGWQGYDSSATGTSTGLGSAAAGMGAAFSGSSASSQSDLEGDLAGSPDITRTRDEFGAAGSLMRDTGDEVIPVAEEQLHVGKREVSRGRVRIHSRVVERPVQEQVTLRDETIEVERRPVSGDMRSGTLSSDPFQERTIEVEEHDEEAVVSKEARVKEELVVRKDTEQRTETISDTVRKTEVDIEDDRTVRGTGTTGSTDRSR